MRQNFISLENLEVYCLAKELSEIGWEIYHSIPLYSRRTSGGNQFIEATDSTGANIAEGYFRFHYLDKIKFYYTARGSLAESNEHWLELLNKRIKIDPEKYQKFKSTAKNLSLKLNNFITSTYKAKDSYRQSR